MVKNKKISQTALDAQSMLDNPNHSKVRVTINIDGDILEEIKNMASFDGDKYQPWLNRFLISVLLSKDSFAKKIKDDVVKEIDSLYELKKRA